MRDVIENVSSLQNQINELQLENQILKNLLDSAGISYKTALDQLKKSDILEPYDPEQGKRIIHPSIITENMAKQFYARFWGRMDVYAKRSVNKNGEAGYYPKCRNFWTDKCPKKFGKKTICGDCYYLDYARLTIDDILNHLKGVSYNSSDVIGVYPLLSNNTCRFLVFDFDNHEKGAEKQDYANIDDTWMEEVEAMRSICVMNGIDPLVERSRSGRGAHIWIFFDKPIDASLARKFGFSLLEKGAEQVNLKSFKYYDRMLPAQDTLSEGGLGNLIALPLQGKAIIDGNSAFIDSNWNAYPDQWNVLKSKPRLSEEFIQIKLKEWNIFILNEKEHANKPWENQKEFNKRDLDGSLKITLSNGIFIDTLYMKPAMQNKIRRLAAIRNPIFYKNQHIDVSNYATSSWIYLGEDYLNGYIRIPRGNYDSLIKMAKHSDIEYVIDDERTSGSTIDVSFNGELREEQIPALKELSSYDNGILQAATAFGKTVVCSALIAEKKVNTLIILESSSLIEQWVESLNKFLTINENLPSYMTKTGKIRKRKSIIGKLQGSHDSLTGIVDIAMVGSICKKGKMHPFLDYYGMIIVDECHHAASETFTKVLEYVKSKYVYGVTATPNRSDGLEKINYMLLGPIRYRYTAKEKAKAQGIDHLVYPRFTRTVMPRDITNEKIHPNEAYEIIRNNDLRDEQIVSDVKECIKLGRTPVVLSKYKDHSQKLYELLKECANHVFLMTGNNSKKEHKKILEEMHKITRDESIVLIATGSLIGEGFDYPRLDTLIMATPVSFKSVVEQYAGRLNRDFEGKQNVIVFDYVDGHIPMFNKMYMKRVSAYKQIGYSICSEVNGERQEANSIFDSENYLDTFNTDLLNARNSIIISSPAISGSKVHNIMKLLKERQKYGVDVTIVTWEPDSYGFGDPYYWMQLHDEMRQVGFNIKVVEENCDHYAIIDKEIVWYGNMNLLGKDKAEDNMIRVIGKKLAGELLELSFGD